MKKLYPEAPDVPQSVANRAVRIIEKHLRVHRVSRAAELPEEAKVRLYRDLQFYLGSDGKGSGPNPEEQGFSIRRWFSRLFERLENFLSTSGNCTGCGPAPVLTWIALADTSRMTVMPICQQRNCPEAS